MDFRPKLIRWIGAMKLGQDAEDSIDVDKFLDYIFEVPGRERIGSIPDVEEPHSEPQPLQPESDDKDAHRCNSQRKQFRPPVPFKTKSKKKFQEHRYTPKYWKNEQN
eukprot:5018973-Amphidinium_carterae.2